MNLLLDTDIVSNILLPNPNETLKQRLLAVPSFQQHISTITLSELLYGFERNRSYDRRREVFELLMLPKLTVVPFDEASARQCATLRCTLQGQGRMLDDADLRIAATALAHNLALITGNDRHFRRVPGLRVYNWLRED